MWAFHGANWETIFYAVNSYGLALPLLYYYYYYYYYYFIFLDVMAIVRLMIFIKNIYSNK